jgi:endonuclease-3 related protein
MTNRRYFTELYDRLLARFGPQHWWPGDTPFEVMIGAILTQNTNWSNVEKALANLKGSGAFSPRGLLEMPPDRLAAHIRPSGYYNQKAGKLREFLAYFLDSSRGDASRMARRPTEPLRRELLSLRGIGPETADSILLYALGKPVFVVDTYTRRVLARHGACRPDASYDELQRLFMDRLPPDAKLFNEFHALLVRVGKEHCHKREPRCQGCPLEGMAYPAS